MDEALTKGDRRRRLIRYMLIPALVVILLLVGFFALNRYRSADIEVRRSEIEISTAATRRITEAARFIGSVVPKDLSEVPAPESGRVVEVFVRSGDRVSIGQPLLQISNPERELAISDRMSRIRSDIMAAMNRRGEMAGARFDDSRIILEAERDRNEAAEELRKRETLLTSNVVNEANVQPYRRRLEFAEKVLRQAQASTTAGQSFRNEQLRSMDAQVAALQADYAAASRQKDAFTIRAPASGIVLGLDIATGQALNIGDRIAGIDPRHGFRIVAKLDEFYADDVKEGMDAKLSSSARSLPMKVAHVSPDIREGSFRVELEFVGKPRSLRPGETLQGSIDFPVAGKFVSVPIGPYLEQTGGNWLFVLSPDGKAAERRAVRSGVRSASHIAILSGVRAGESVITSTYRSWADVDSIRMSK